LLHHLHRQPAPVPVPGQSRLLLCRARPDAGGHRGGGRDRAAALRRLPDRDPRGRERLRGPGREHVPLQDAGHGGVVVPHRGGWHLLRVLPVLATAQRGVRHPALGGDRHPAYRGRRGHRAWPDPRLLHPEPACRGVPRLLRPGRRVGRPPHRLRHPADRRRALPAPGRLSRAPPPLGAPGRSVTPLLEVSGLSRRFGGLQAVNDLSLSMARDEVLGLIGPNGAGKTTAFNLLSGFLAPDRGRIRFDGRSIVGLSPHAICHLGLCRTFQIVRPFPRLSVLDNVRVGALSRRPRMEDARDRAREVIEQVGLGGKMDHPAGGLTLAERKRLELARALATEPRLLLLDEVMAGLNPTEIEAIVALVKRINASGIAIMLIEHNMRAVMSLSHRIAVLNFGEKIVEGEPAAVANHPRVIEAYLGEEYVHAPSRSRSPGG